MNIKSIVTVVLFLFFASSVVYLAVTESGKEEEAVDKTSAEAATVESQPDSSQEVEKSGRKIAAYYFFTTQRCVSCKKIEMFSFEAIHGRYSKEIEDSSLEWKTVNVDLPENKHYLKDYDLVTKSLVIVETVDGKQTRWKNLSKVWELLMDESAFKSYVQDELDSYIKET